MSEFEKAQCTCSHGYTCRAMTDPNCCAHSCDYNDLVDALNVIKLQRDALAAKCLSLENFCAEVSAVFENVGDSPINSARLKRIDSVMNVDAKAVLAAHDAEVAANAVIEFSDHLVDIGQLRSAYPSEEYAAQLRAKAKQ